MVFMIIMISVTFRHFSEFFLEIQILFLTVIGYAIDWRRQHRKSKDKRLSAQTSFEGKSKLIIRLFYLYYDSQNTTKVIMSIEHI